MLYIQINIIYDLYVLDFWWLKKVIAFRLKYWYCYFSIPVSFSVCDFYVMFTLIYLRYVAASGALNIFCDVRETYCDYDKLNFNLNWEIFCISIFRVKCRVIFCHVSQISCIGQKPSYWNESTWKQHVENINQRWIRSQVFEIIDENTFFKN